MVRLIGPLVRLLGEPVRTVMPPEEMQALLARFGLGVRGDHALPELAADLAPELAHATRPMAHLRLATAERA